MALKLPIPFPILFQPLSTNPNLNPKPSTTEVRFARWNNARYREFNEQQRTQKELEDEIRRNRRYDSATKLAELDPSYTVMATNDNLVFKSTGTPSSPSKPSIPGKKSKYSKPHKPDKHPAFQRNFSKPTKITSLPLDKPVNPKANISVTEDGVSYVIDGAPFEFRYSYTETPKVKPLKLRETYVPFGPTTMARPWTGRAPLPASKKKLKEFDSFRLPPPNKKGVKPVQHPGPFLPGTGPRYVSSREEILGEPLTKQEVKELLLSCIKSKRQLNMGRDGFTHNMLDNIHAHWKRRRVCKIKCKGVCTVDMDTVCHQLEEKTGGKIIYRRGGVLFLFRGRNYNYKTRPRFPLMLWRPITPVYPKLIKLVPEGLTLEEVTEMRDKGRKLIPICKLGKNGVYCNLVREVREAFQVCELVRINCQGLNPSDFKKIGGKLKDLVPCVLIAFENEHILMWRGRDWKSSFEKPDNDSGEGKESEDDGAIPVGQSSDGNALAASCTDLLLVEAINPDTLNKNILPVNSLYGNADTDEVLSSVDDAKQVSVPDTDGIWGVPEIYESGLDEAGHSDTEIKATEDIDGDSNGTYRSDGMSENKFIIDEEPGTAFVESGNVPESVDIMGNQSESSNVGSLNHVQLESPSEIIEEHNETSSISGPHLDRVLLLMKEAVEGGSALVLDDAALDADVIFKRVVSFAKSAPPGPVFRYRVKKVAAVQDKGKKEGEILEVKNEGEVLAVRKEAAPVIAVAKKAAPVFEKRVKKAKQVSDRKKSINDDRSLDVMPESQGSLRVDELAKLLA